MRDSRTDEQIEQDVVDMAVHIWDKRDVFASKCLMLTYCTCPEHGEPRLKTWCIPEIATMDSLCSGCWVHRQIQDMKDMRDKYNMEHDAEQKMFRELGASVARQLTNEPPASWRQPKLDVDDFARL